MPDLTEFWFEREQISVNIEHSVHPEPGYTISNVGGAQYINLTEKEFFQLFMCAKQVFEGQQVDNQLYRQYMLGEIPNEWPPGFMETVVGGWADMPDEILNYEETDEASHAD